ncbi:MAG: hypothetical protein GQ574_17220 [Crocinitomix sp.]|nr:hypothetical protein [Crocinitomix sp.]
MRLRTFLGLFIVASFLQGCFIADELFLEEDEGKSSQLDLQATAEGNVTKKIQTDLGDNEYTPYGFSQLKVIKPLQIVELEEMELQLRLHPKDSTLKADIQKQKTFLRANNIERTAELSHFFTLISDTMNINILEAKYTLNDTLAVKEVNPEILLTVPLKYQLMIDYYFNEYTIIIARSYTEGKLLSKSFYRFFKDQLETYTTVSQKSAFLKHTLDICTMVKFRGNFDQEYIVQNVLQQFVKNERKDIKNYAPLEFSTLYETKNNDNNSVVGYYFFHKFIGNFADQKDTNVVLVEFSPYYQVDQIFQLDGTYESYTNQLK